MKRLAPVLVFELVQVFLLVYQALTRGLKSKAPKEPSSLHAKTSVLAQHH